MAEKIADELIRITGGSGFHMTFANGYTVSVQFGSGNSCSNRRYVRPSGRMASDTELGMRGCPNAEVAVWKDDGPMLELPRFYKSKHTNYGGWMSPDEIAKIISWAASRKA